jgi:hypothetical protein
MRLDGSAKARFHNLLIIITCVGVVVQNNNFRYGSHNIAKYQNDHPNPSV